MTTPKTNRTRYKANVTITAREGDAMRRFMDGRELNGDRSLAYGVIIQLLANADKEAK